MSSPDTPMVASWTRKMVASWDKEIFVSTHLWNTPLNLDSFHNWRGLPWVCYGGVSFKYFWVVATQIFFMFTPKIGEMIQFD